MDSFLNDPLGAMSKAATSVASVTKKAADDLAKSEALKNAKEKSWNGLVTAGNYAGHIGEKAKKNANDLYEKNYHGQLYEGAGKALGQAGETVGKWKKEITTNKYQKNRDQEQGYELGDGDWQEIERVSFFLFDNFRMILKSQILIIH